MKPKSLVLSFASAALAVVAIAPMMQAAPQAQTKQPGKCSNWAARIDRTGSDSTLVVTGKCTFPTDGYSVRLERTEPQGINPKYLLLSRKVEPPSDQAAQVVSEELVTYRERPSVAYTNVTIRPDGITIPIKQRAR